LIPKDGLRTSQRPPGRIATRWLMMLDGLDERLKGRIVRGKTLARSGRVREMELAPGTALAMVQDADAARPTIRVRTFDEAEWAKVLDTLRKRLSLLAKLLEGEVADDLMTALDEQHVPLVPRTDEIDGDCDCGDWAVPCAHGAALHHVLGEALDGEPFLLFTLRGRTREQLLAELRRGWGDTVAGRDADTSPIDDAEHEGDPFTSPVPAPLLSFRFYNAGGAPGMLELGPLAGDEDLQRALAPLYEEGANSALRIAMAEGGAQDSVRRRRGRSAIPTAAQFVPRDALAQGSPMATPVEEVPEDLTESIVDVLAEADDGATAESIAKKLHISVDRIKAELDELLSIGLVACSGRREPRWYLG
jgi:uncharacterized Zn finger protein